MKPVKFNPTGPKEPVWPAHFHATEGDGTLYVQPYELPKIIEKHKYKGQAWEYRREWKTYKPGKGLAYKSIHSLSPTDEEDFWHIMSSCYKQGIKPPSSFASIFHSLFSLPWPRKSVIAPFVDQTSGAWSMALKLGTFHEHVYHYDINSAYRWAACQGLPDTRSAQRVFDFDAQDSIFLVEWNINQTPPWPLNELKGMVTSEELKVIPFRPKLIFGIQFKDWLDFSGVFKEIDCRFPWCYKRISRAFWGRWNGDKAVRQHGWKDGHKVRELPNPLHNPIWAHYITSRIKLRLYETIGLAGTVHVQVDAVLCRERLPVSNDVGGWVLKHEYPKGIWVKGTGQWGVGNLIVKRMGLTTREAEQWLITKS